MSNDETSTMGSKTSKTSSDNNNNNNHHHTADFSHLLDPLPITANTPLFLASATVSRVPRGVDIDCHCRFVAVCARDAEVALYSIPTMSKVHSWIVSECGVWHSSYNFNHDGSLFAVGGANHGKNILIVDTKDRDGDENDNDNDEYSSVTAAASSESKEKKDSDEDSEEDSKEQEGEEGKPPYQRTSKTPTFATKYTLDYSSLNHANISAIAFSPHEPHNMLVSVSSSNTGYIWNFKTESVLHKIEDTGDMCCLDFHPTDKNIFVTGSHSNNIKFWHVETGAEEKKYSEITRNRIYSVKFIRSGKYLAIASADETVKIITTESGKVIFNHRVGDWVKCVCFDQHERCLVCTSDNGVVSCFNIESYLNQYESEVVKSGKSHLHNNNDDDGDNQSSDGEKFRLHFPLNVKMYGVVAPIPKIRDWLDGVAIRGQFLALISDNNTIYLFRVPFSNYYQSRRPALLLRYQTCSAKISEAFQQYRVFYNTGLYLPSAGLNLASSSSASSSRKKENKITFGVVDENACVSDSD